MKLVVSFGSSKKISPEYNFGPKLVKSMDYAIIDPLEYIFNLSLTEKAPIKMKTAKVIPVFKKGKTDLMSNYRPISLLSIFDKLLEKIAYTRLFNFLCYNNILCKYQFGFRKFHSTSMALIDVVDNIFEHLDKRDIGVGICIDL